jgi:hypothetical protein
LAWALHWKLHVAEEVGAKMYVLLEVEAMSDDATAVVADGDIRDEDDDTEVVDDFRKETMNDGEAKTLHPV